MRKYLSFLLKTEWINTLLIMIIPLLISLTAIFCSFNYFPRGTGGEPYSSPNLDSQTLALPVVLLIPIVFGFLTQFILIIKNFSRLKDKRAVDILYSLPLSRRKLVMSITLFTILQILAVFIINAMSSYLFFKARYSSYDSLSIFLMYLGTFVSLFFSSFALMFVFMMANNKGDGMIFLGLLYVIAFLLQISLFLPLSHEHRLIDDYAMTLYPFGAVAAFINRSLELSIPIIYLNSSHTSYFDGQYIIGQYQAIWLNIVVYFTLGGYGFYYLLNTKKYEKTENIGYLSTNIFGYPVLIPLLLTMIGIVVSQSVFLSFFAYIGGVIVLVLGFIFYYIYRKSLKFRVQDYLTLVACLVFYITINIFAFNQ